MRPKNYYQNLKSVCLRRQNLVLLLGAYFTALNFYFPETCRTMSLAYISKPVFDNIVADTASCWKWSHQPMRGMQTSLSPKPTADYLCWFVCSQVWRQLDGRAEDVSWVLLCAHCKLLQWTSGWLRGWNTWSAAGYLYFLMTSPLHSF